MHVAAERSPELIAAVVYRLFNGMAHADGPPSIVDAWVEKENLVLLSPSFDRLAVPLKQLAKLIGTEADKIEAFEIDEDGRFLFWPHADVHLGWEQFLQIVDPAVVRGLPFGSEQWVENAAEQLGRQSTLRRRGGPRKNRADSAEARN